MSDLQCPARILVARHGEATDDDPALLSDDGGRLTETGVHQATALAERLAGERVAAVYASRLDRALETARIVGRRLGLPATVVDGVEELPGEEVVRRFALAVEGLADRHRGETVVVVSHGGVMTLGITHTAANVTAAMTREAYIPNCAVVEVAVDADGWRLVGPWPGRARTPQPDASEQPGPDVVDAP